MKRTFLAVVLCFAAPALFAQVSTFRFGPRYSNYDTNIDLGVVGVDTGRESSLGAVGEFRTGVIVLKGQYDHDFESSIAFEFLPLEVARYSRDRGELAVGWGATKNIDLDVGMRFDNIDVSSNPIFGGEGFGGNLNLDNQAIRFGVEGHSSTDRPFGWYVAGKGYVGSAKFNVQDVRVKSDTNGLSFEGGFRIPLGLSGWEITPGAEWERLETQDYNLNMDTNRFFVNFTYAFGG